MSTLGGHEELAHFVARMKLTELERQHARLQAAYTEIEHSADEAASPAAAACALWDGLGALRVANRELHPDLDDIAMLRAMVDARIGADDIGATWVERLRREVDQGRARASVAHTFGRLLEELTAPDEREPEDGNHALEQWTQSMLEPPRATSHTVLFDSIFDVVDAGEIDAVRRRVASLIEDTACIRDALYDEFNSLAEVCRSEDLDVVANVVADDAMFREFADAICIMIEHVEDWRWPETVEHEARWTRDRWRIYPREPLSVATFVEVACGWVLDAVHSSLGETAQIRADRLAKLIDLNAPAVVIENERRMLAEATSLTQPRRVVFDELVEDATAAQRREEMRRLKKQSERGSYDYDATLVKAASLVAAEVRLQRAARPGRPVWVLKTDIANFYPSVEHDVLLDLLARLGVEPTWHDLIARFLAIPVDGQPAQRGLPMGHRASRALGELLLQFMDDYVRHRADVRIIRAVDDIAILAADATEAIAAYRAVCEFLDGCGLTINEAKSGCVAIGGDPAELADAPQGPASWGILTLDADGEWSVDDAAIDERIARTRTRMGEAIGVLRRVDVYNDEARGLIAYLGLGYDFGDAHRDRVRAAVDRFVTSMGAVAAEAGAAWLRWPITAGGLGLYDPMIDLLAFELSRRQRALPDVPAADLVDDEAREHWADYYLELVREVHPVRPDRGTPNDALVDDFVARNRELHGSAADDLSPYWTWILHTYGPQILERFGTFRFLLTELVPLRLILQARR